MGKSLKYSELKTRMDHLFGADEQAGNAKRETGELKDIKIAILSDQHRGIGNGADDFCASQSAYAAALAYYREQGFRLFLLGDVEELWEIKISKIDKIIQEYDSIYQQEIAFQKQDPDRYIRFYGNHDVDLFAKYDTLSKQSRDLIGGQKPIEGLKLNVTENGEALGQVLFAHGDQGNEYSKTNVRSVRYLWSGFQKLTHIGSGVPSKNHQLRGHLETRMAAWLGERQRTTQSPSILLMGHTHHPVFEGANHSQFLQRRIDELKAARGPQQEIAYLAAEKAYIDRELVKEKLKKQSDIPDDEGLTRSDEKNGRPRYFNTGCCCFWDGEITSMEIHNGELSLIRWSGSESNAASRDEPTKHVRHVSRLTLASTSLKRLLPRGISTGPSE